MQIVGDRAAQLWARFCKSFFLAGILSAIIAEPCEATIVTIAATANPFLADPANAPDQTSSTLDGTGPAAVNLSGFTGNALNILALGRTSDTASGSLAISPDGGSAISGNSQGGISGFTSLPSEALIGVFLGSTIGPAPNPVVIQTDAAVTSPQLGQIFFIGDGLTGTGSGTPQDFQIPSGATSLYLANADASTWKDDVGSFKAIVISALLPIPQAVVVPEPGTIAMLAVGVLSLLFAGRRHRRRCGR